MSRSLQDLNRDELLELVIRLSNEYDKVSAENDRLNRVIIERNLPRTAKVGSIAEAALQVNGFYEAVQRSADAYLREIKYLKSRLAAQVDERQVEQLEARAAAAQQAEAEAYARLQDTQERMSQVVENAQNQASAMIADAHAKADQILHQANSQATVMTRQLGRRNARLSAESLPSPQQPAMASRQTEEIVRRARHSRPLSEGTDR